VKYLKGYLVAFQTLPRNVSSNIGVDKTNKHPQTRKQLPRKTTNHPQKSPKSKIKALI